jgi:hypothetical protein
MAANFRISARRKGRDMEINLAGDFDGTSAYELLHFLNKNCSSCDRVIIKSDLLKKIYTFGQDIFQNNLSLLNSQHIQIVFTGKNADKIVPERIKCT